ncbi:MAG: ExeM/NucH family extracellular endonuclease, partial [Anaerolineaceae bacterium]|nr:ExeM/NucH family extracellular endonuclease [Anaerolineaceae bacterium]
YLETCTVTVVAANVNDDDLEDDTYDYMFSDYVFSFDTAAPPEVCGDPFTPIYDIQGSGAATLLDANTEISTEGVVVGDFQTNAYVSGTKNGFYIQAITGDGDPLTSDGVFVYSTLVDVQAGDHVRVTGKPVEYFSLTQISSVTNILTCSSGNTITPTTLSLPVASDFDYETVESMLVTYPQALIISEYFNYDRYGEIVLTSQRHMTFTAEFEPGTTEYAAAMAEFALDKIILDDGRTSQNPDPALHPNGLTFDLTNRFRGGDTLTNLTGILDYYFDLYRIQATKGADYLAANPRQTELSLAEGDLTVASFNVLNYFLDIDTGSWICGPSSNMECRGADDATELARQRAKILAAMSDIEADVFGLMEIQNDTGASTANLVSGLNDIFGADTYDYIDTGYIGTDAIKQALIYKPSTVTPLGLYEILDSSYDPAFIDTANRPVLAQTFTDNLTGKSFTVAVNHLKSKGSACSGDPDLGDGAGNCNLTRKAAAEVLVDWLADATIFPDVTNYLIIGDLNSYDKEDPIDAIKLGADDTASTDDDFVDMVDFFQGELAYGYVFDGQVGYLDYALANNALAARITDTDLWHINADEPDLLDYDMSYKLPAQDLLYEPNAFRSSDHDPVIIRISFNNTPVAQDDAYETPEDTLLEVAAPGVLDNDLDGDDEDTLTADLVTDVTAGTLILDSDGSFSFMPPEDGNGDFTFTYRIFDGTDYSNTVTVTITVTPLNDSPVAEDDYYETDWNVVLNVPAPGVLANDGDPDTTDIMSVVLMTPTQHGIITLSANGAFIYTPNPGFSGEDSFIYALVSLPGSERVGGYADTATVYITVHPPFTIFLPLILN